MVLGSWGEIRKGACQLKRYLKSEAGVPKSTSGQTERVSLCPVLRLLMVK